MTAKITTFTKPALRGFEDDLLAHIKAFAEARGLKVEPNGGTFDALSFTARVKFTVDDPSALEAKEKNDFDTYCRLFDLEPKHFGVKVVLNGKPMTLCGLAMSRAKYPLKFKDANGKITLYTRDILPKIKMAA